MRYWIILGIVGILAACVGDRPEQTTEPVNFTASRGVWIANEGNFQFGNASLSYYNIEDSTYVQNVYQLFNEGKALGDVFQSITFHQHQAFCVINNSQKIVVLNPYNFKQVATIENLNSPRYFAGVSKSKGYVTDLYANEISVLNLTTYQVTKSIPCAGWTEGLLYKFGKLYVCNRTAGKLYIVDVTTDHITDSIALSKGTNTVIEDGNGKLWVACSGSVTENIPAALYQINPLTNSIQQSIIFPNNQTISLLTVNGKGDFMYYRSGNNIFKMATDATQLPTQAFITTTGINIYGLGVDPVNGDIYLSDAIDYTQNGKLYRYDANGKLIHQFKGGIIPGAINFW